MKLEKYPAIIISLTLLAACEQASKTDIAEVAEPPPAAVVELPIRYSVIDLAELDGPAALTSLCEQENQTLRDHMAQLEAFDGTATIDGYYKSLDSLIISLRNVEVAGAYRDIVLGAGGTKPAAELVTEFLGREISFKPYADKLSGK